MSNHPKSQPIKPIRKSCKIVTLNIEEEVTVFYTATFMIKHLKMKKI